MVCLLMASKYDELDDNIPMVKDFIKINKNSFIYEEFIEEEGRILDLINWRLIAVTPLHFVTAFLGLGIIFENDKYFGKTTFGPSAETLLKLDEALLKKCHKFAVLFSELSYRDYSFQ